MLSGWWIVDKMRGGEQLKKEAMNMDMEPETCLGGFIGITDGYTEMKMKSRGRNGLRELVASSSCN